MGNSDEILLVFPGKYRAPNPQIPLNMFHFDPPWHSKKYVKKLHAISAVTRYTIFSNDRVREASIPLRVAYGILNRMARYRWRKRHFDFALEMRLIDALAKKFRGWV